MIRITREADYGILLMTSLTRAEGQPRSAAALARQCRLPLPMVSKILKTLARASFLTSQRGVQGGYSLTRPPAEISAADIIGALEGPLAITECSGESHEGCSRQDECEVSGHWPRINRAIHAALQSISLAEMSRPDAPRPLRFHSPSRTEIAGIVDRAV
ncbi:MAG: SUF system Fe-S cluster assembly regulator [Candidatus Contendobacter sp.]|nr:SUF system Fe-S cluster assembly regulator [Candidatus Contendobacter sp.]MDG4596815.1 SUF system Fe-S cluster assembly regulator [Candidatus Contendobacter sp.]